jgi:hypothetical protein
MSLAVLVAIGSASCTLTVTGLDDFTTCQTGCSDAGPEASPNTITEAGSEMEATCDAVPSDWALVTRVAGSQACPSGLNRTFLENPRPESAECTCSCGAPPSNPCESAEGTYPFKIGLYGGPCTSDGSGLTKTCSPVGSWSVAVTSVSGSPRAPVTLTCPATATLPRVISDTEVELCPHTQACGRDACVLHDGEGAVCPSGFEVRRVLTGKDELEDGRSCGACSCNSKASACTNATFTLYTDDNCTTGARAAVFNDACHPFDSSGPAFKTYQYRATPNVAGCAPVQPTSKVTGELKPKARVTLCCRTAM